MRLFRGMTDGALLEMKLKRAPEALQNHGRFMTYTSGSPTISGQMKLSVEAGCQGHPLTKTGGSYVIFSPISPWVYKPHQNTKPFKAYANWLEVGWALCRKHWGHGYASEIGRASINYAFETLNMQAVVSCTARHNDRSQGVMGRIGLNYVGEIYSPGIAKGEKNMRSVSRHSLLT